MFLSYKIKFWIFKSKAEWEAVKTIGGPGAKKDSDDDNEEPGGGSGMSGRAKWGKKEPLFKSNAYTIDSV